MRPKCNVCGGKQAPIGNGQHLDTKYCAETKAKKLITQYRTRLRGQAICENFGQSYVRKLEDKFSDYRYGQNPVWPLIREFDNWCMTYAGG